MGMVYTAIYEKTGLLEDYNVLCDDTIRNNLFEVLILFPALGAFLTLIPFCFYDLTENLLSQAENYTHCEELEEEYLALKNQ